MDALITLSYLTLLWPILCSAQQSTFTVATLQIADEIWNAAPSPTIFMGTVSTSINNSDLVTAYTIPCVNGQFCTSGEALGFTVTSGSTTYDLVNYGTVVCGVTDDGSGPSGTAICTETAPHGEFYTQSTSVLTFTESSSYAIYFASMDPDLSSSLGATTTTSIPTSAAATSAAAPSAAAPSTVAMTTDSPTETSGITSTSASSSAFITTSASSTSAPTTQTAQTTSSSPTSSATGSHNLTEHEKIGVGVGIVAFVLVCCVIGFFLRSYRRKRRAANPNPSELYFNADEKGQASGT